MPNKIKKPQCCFDVEFECCRSFCPGRPLHWPKHKKCELYFKEKFEKEKFHQKRREIYGI